MSEINRLEKYIQEKKGNGGKRKKRIVFLFLVFFFCTLLLFLGGYFFNDIVEMFSLKPENKTVSTKEVKQTNTKDKTLKTQEQDSEKPTHAPSPTQVPSSLPTLIIKGEFLTGEPLMFSLENADGVLRHEIDFGDGDNSAIKRKAYHTYTSPGEYQIIFTPDGKNIPSSKTIFISKQKEDNDEFESSIRLRESKEKLKAILETEFENKASFPGGTEAFMAYLQTHMGNVSGHRGRVLIRFVVNEKGELEQPEILDGIHPKVDNEVLKAFKGMPKWKPAITNGKKVKSEYRIPIYFTKET